MLGFNLGVTISPGHNLQAGGCICKKKGCTRIFSPNVSRCAGIGGFQLCSNFLPLPNFQINYYLDLATFGAIIQDSENQRYYNRSLLHLTKSCQQQPWLATAKRGPTPAK